MVFKRLLGSLGVGGPTVDTVLDPGAARPGGTLSGRVRLVGGTADHDVEHVALELVARVETEREEHGDGEGVVVFDRHVVGGAFRLAAGEETSVPFAVPLPWETPATELHGQPLGIVLGVRTELAVAGARDKGDLDPLTVAPLPAQEAVLEALGQLGFGFRSADLEYGRIGGTGQQLPFYQEVELTPPPRYAHQVNEIELTFLAVPGALEVVLEADKRGGLFAGGHGGHDALSRFTVPHEGPSGPQDWNTLVDGWIQELVEHRASYGSHAVYGHESGVGAAVVAGAAGIAGGMVAAEVVDEVGDFFEGDSDDGEG
ncbi:sporulation protein [Streptomyces coelicoflavus]|uniref:Sporulation protein n=1 Tax=Streptomyces coelicoflavus TaxID=285562 RepID=A0A6N9UR65_9ACTN|nr:sporulation protein [Streptomyces coelicoflavus]NEB19066.1 sporulation protein [Streptomyces coelicoflavus]